MKNNQKIFIVSMNGTSNAGGVEKVSYYLNEILSEKYDVKFITKTKLNFGKINNLIQPILISLKLLFKHNRLIIANSWHCFLYPADISIHHGTSAGIMDKTGENNLSLKLTAWMEKVSAKKAKSILSVSENCKKELISYYGIPEEKIYVINNFVEDSVFYPLKDTQKKEEINVCFSGALCYKKGIDILKSLTQYIENHDLPRKIKFNIATNFDRNTEDFKNLKKITLQTGLNSSQMPDFYRKNDILFFPTRYEGFSMAALEAVSSGLCLIGSDFAVTPEFINYPFCQQIHFNTQIEEIVKGIIKLYDEFHNKKQEIHNQIKKDFGTEQYKQKLFSFINKIIENK